MALLIVLIIILIVFINGIIIFNRTPLASPHEQIIYTGGEGRSINIVAPSYGKIIDILPHDENKIIIKILLTIFDVHVQYAPISGTLIDLTHNVGSHNPVFKNTVSSGKTLENEHMKYQIKSDIAPFDITMYQIAGMFARRCVSFYAEGSYIEYQKPIGRILFGSQVDIIIPKCELMCKIGDNLIGGKTIIAVI